MSVLKLNRIDGLPEQITLPVSKSVANRWLILQALFPNQIAIPNFENVDDTAVLKNGLLRNSTEINVGHAGTAMRFLCAFLSTQKGKTFILSGSERMHQRPIAPLVIALKKLGAKIEYLKNDGFPPLKIVGQDLNAVPLEIDSSLSSQYISALLLIGARVKGGLHLKLKNQVVSSSYIRLTLSVLKAAGIRYKKPENEIRVFEQKRLPEKIEVQLESDWSAAAFWYGMVALLPASKTQFIGLDPNSAQGDKKLIDFYESFGVRTKRVEGGVKIFKIGNILPEFLRLNLLDQPDLAQPIAVTCAALGVHVKLTGLQTLANKETHRLEALQKELANFGVQSAIKNDSIEIAAQEIISPLRPIKTYNDHRMAMSFAILATKFRVEIEIPEVVRKSYPGFWEDLQNA